MTAFGHLRITAQANLGADGLRESDPVFYHWPWYNHIPSLGLWILLAVALVVPKANRDRRALLVLVPALILMLLLRPFLRMTGANAGDLEQFRMLFGSLVVGLALLWLNAGHLGRYRGLMSFALSLGLVLLAAGLGTVSYGMEQVDDATIYLLFVATMSLALVTALRVARRLTGRRYRPLRFMLFLAAASVLLAPLGVLVFIGVEVLIHSGTLSDLRGLLFASGLVGLIAALCLYAVNLPYMLLMFSSPFFRRRFQDWLGVPAVSPPAETAPGGG